MTPRRWLLVAGLLIFCASAARRVGASGPADVEVSAYDGAASGGWVCGPSARIRYGGVGAQVRLHPLSPADDAGAPPGLAFTVGAAGDMRAYTLLTHCSGNCSSGSNTQVPPGGFVGGGTALFGYDSHVIGFHGGLVAWQHYASATDAAPTWAWVPQFALRIGRPERVHLDLGLGSYDVPTILRPGAYLGLAWAPAPGWECAVHGGVHQTFDVELGLRGALGLKAPLADQLQIGASVALSSGAFDAIEPEGQLVLVWHP